MCACTAYATAVCFRSPRTLVEKSQCSERSRTSRRRLFMSKPTIDVYGLGVFFSNPEMFFPSQRNPGVFVQAEVFSPTAWRGGLPKRSMCFSQAQVFFSNGRSFFFQAPGCFFLIEDVFFPSIHFCCGISLGPPSLGPPSLGPPKFLFFFFLSDPHFIFFRTFSVSLVDLEC